MSDETPKLHIDSDWKAEAQAEKERLAAAVDEKSGKRTTPPTDRARDGCAALPSSEAALAGGCRQQHGPRVPATTRCRFRGY